MSNYQSVRRFFFVRADGSNKPLNGEVGIWLSDPAGLGATKTPTYANLNSGFFVMTDGKQDAQQTIAFTLNFVSADPYSDYTDLVNWLEATTELYLGYQPGGVYGTMYKRRIDVKSISKTELNKVRWLTAAVTVDCLSPWMEEIALDGAHTTTPAIPAWYWQPVAAGQLPAAFRLSFKAHSARNISRLTLGYSLGTDLVQKGISFTDGISLAAGDTLEISTAPNDYYIRVRANNGEVTSKLDAVSVVYDPVVLLPPGAAGIGGETAEALQLFVDAIDELDDVNCAMLVYYRSV